MTNNNYLDKFKLNNKTVLINGGLGLIGSEISIACITAGANVIIVDIKKNKSKNIGKLFLNLKQKPKIINLDTSNYKNIEKNYKKIIDNNKIDVFINTSYPKDDFWNKNSFKDIKLQSFRKNIDMNMISYAWLTKLIADHMKKNKLKGSIILLASIYGLLGQDLSIYKNTKIKENMTYSIIKGGIINLTKQMASYYGKYNIRVNNICPGGVLEKNLNSNKNLQSKIFIKNYSNKVPLKRLAKTSEIASSALFLSSDASSYVTGTSLVVDGGWTAI
tara:strand:+ start:1260 stop:2084 length:825 start_codon:yes stop_codon:yes gene_type:complete